VYWAADRPEISPNILANYYTKVKKKLQEIRIFSQFLGILLWEWDGGIWKFMRYQELPVRFRIGSPDIAVLYCTSSTALRSPFP
jgi:hypothetical protein